MLSVGVWRARLWRGASARRAGKVTVMMRAMTARLGAAAFGLGIALVPAFLSAAEPVTETHGEAEHSGPTFEAAARALETGADMGQVMWLTILSLGGLFVLATVGYAYRQKRALHWRFQQPDAPHDAHH